MAGEAGKRGEACEGGEEVGGAGGRIAACKSLASQRPVGGVSVGPQTSWSPHRESISLGASTSLSAFELPLVSVCQLVSSPRCVSVHPQQVTRVTPEPAMAPVSERLQGHPSLGEASLCPSVGLT